METTRPRSVHRSRVVLIVLLLALVGLACVGGGAVWERLNTKRVETGFALPSGHLVHGWEIEKRWGKRAGTRHGPQVIWDEDTGLLFSRGLFRDGRLVSRTFWDRDGRVIKQVRMSDGTVEPKVTPPWWWGVVDQARPTDGAAIGPQ